MPIFDVILPTGYVILKDRETGATLRLSADDGPVTLGIAELALGGHLVPAGTFAGRSAAERPEVPALPPEHREPAPEHREADEALLRMQGLPPGFGPDAGEPFLSPAEGEEPEEVEEKPEGLPPLRTLEAPLEALTEEEFDLSLQATIRARDETEREVRYLQEIEGDPDDIAELEARKLALDVRFAELVHRFEEWKLLQRRLDEDRAMTPAE
ncbi:hypothetical protein [Sutterella sp.]|uniref:hypothetical protein n=1 Tax=Sutterella sp. TaxID=1981025 RepID=UPI0026DEFD40|nr:hypothetical protein [Sutterella sp.]MDO5531156.1 hypothetical protein [Sutterella sp.]